MRQPHDTANVLLILAGLKLILRTLRLSVLVSLTVLTLPLILYSAIPHDWNILALAVYSIILTAYAVGTSKHLNPANKHYTPDEDNI